MEPSLFSSGPRPDFGPAPYVAGAYELLDTSPRAASERVRRLLDGWWARLPSAAAAQIHNRFTDRSDIVHLGAFFELYLDALSRAMGFDVDIDVGRDTNNARRPDLMLQCAEHDLFVEATAVAGDDVYDVVTRGWLGQIHDAVNDVVAPGFFVELEVTRHGSGTPSRTKITASVQRFLDGHDPDKVLADIEAGRELPTRDLAVGGWEMSLIAEPLRPEHRDDPHHRVVGSRFDGMDSIDDLTPLRRKLKRKAGRYGELGKPYVLAVLCAGTFVEDCDINAALMGSTAHWYDIEARGLVSGRQRDGTWIGPNGPINRRLSGLLSFNGLSPTAMFAVQPTLWLNPWASHPLPDPGPWRRVEFRTGGWYEEHPAQATIAEVFGLVDG